MWYINGTRLDDRIIRTDWDAGFVDGRQFGRGRSGGQVSAKEVVYITSRTKTMKIIAIVMMLMEYCL